MGSLFFATYLYGEDGKKTWSLKECLSYAKENNLQIKQSSISVEEAKNNVTQSTYDLLPSVNGSLSHDMSWGRSVNMQTLKIIKNQRNMNTSGSVSASLDIFNGLEKINTLKSNRTQLQIARQRVEKLKNDITIQVTKAYLQLLLAQEIAKSAEQNCRSTAEQVNRTSQLVEAGSQAYSTLLEVKSQLAGEKSQLVDAQNNVRSNTLALMQLLELPVEESENFAIEQPKEEADIYPTETVESIYSRALFLPQIREAELSLRKSRYDYKATYGRLFPSLSINAGYGSYYTDGQDESFFTQFDHNKSHSIGFSLRVPIFNGLSVRSSVRNARLAVEASSLEVEIQKNNLYKEVQTAYNEAFSALEKMRSAAENFKSIKESFTYTENKFNVGMMNATDYIVAKSTLFSAESSFYQAKYQYIFELKILDFYKGIDITL